MSGEMKGPEGGHPEKWAANTVCDPGGGHLKNLVENTTCFGNDGKCGQHESKKSKSVYRLVCATQMDFGSAV